MTIQQFAEQLEQEHDLSPLLRAVQALRTRDLDRLRQPHGGLFAGWVVWDDDGGGQTQHVRMARPELRN